MHKYLRNLLVKTVCFYLVCLVFEVKHFILNPLLGSLGGFEGVGGKWGVRQKFPLNKNLCIGYDATIWKLSNFYLQ